MNQEKTKDAIVIGAGITGLTAAFYLDRMKQDFLVLEEKERVGGVIKTVRENGFLYETGPNTGILGQPEAALLFEDIGNGVSLEIADKAAKKRYVLKKGRWEPLPSGMIRAIKTPLFTLKDKFRLLGEPFRAKGNNPEETLEDMVLRRMGKSYLDYAVDPFILGIYAGDPHTLIPKYALPKLYNLEQKYGSFIGGSFKKKFERKNELDKKATREIFSCKGGLQSLADALYDIAGHEKFHLRSSDIKVDHAGEYFKVSFQRMSQIKEEYHSKNIIITTGAQSLRGLLPFIETNKMHMLTDIRYAKVIELAIGFNRWSGIRLDGFGGLIPYRENRDLLGILYISSFLSGRAPEEGALFTVYIGGIRRPDLYERSDDEIIGIVKEEFTEVMGMDDFEPDLIRIFRHEWAIPQYEKSSLNRFHMIAEIEREFKGLMLRGNFTGGIGLADRIKQGRQVAMEISGKGYQP